MRKSNACSILRLSPASSFDTIHVPALLICPIQIQKIGNIPRVGFYLQTLLIPVLLHPPSFFLAVLHGEQALLLISPLVELAVSDSLPRLLKRLSNPSRPSCLYWTESWFNVSNPRRYVSCTYPPFNAYILTLPCRPQKTAAGIFLPQSATSNPLPEATVIAVGPGAPNKDGVIVPTQVKAGDRVLLPGWGGNSIKVGDEVRILCFRFTLATLTLPRVFF